MDSEKLLPNDSKLDVFLLEDAQAVRFEIEERRLSEGEILDPLIELSEHEVFQRFAQLIGRNVMGRHDTESQQAVYRAMIFAYEVSSIIHEHNAQFNAGQYMSQLAKSNDYERLLREDAQYYLADNPNVHDLIQYYTDELDQNRQRAELVEISAALIFMLVERNLGDMFLHEMAQNASMEQLFEDR